MARIVFLDDSFPFTGTNLRQQPLGGIQTATVMLAEEFAARGHYVEVRGMVTSDEKHFGVLYRPLFAPWDDVAYDLVISNCVAKLFKYVRGKKRVLWLHGPAQYMRKPRHLWPYLRYRPELVFLGDYHRSTWPSWIPIFDEALIPHGVGAPFIGAAELEMPPAPRALFISHPRRHLDWILDVWTKYIHASMPVAHLHVYASHKNDGSRRHNKLDHVLSKIEKYKEEGVFLHDLLPKKELFDAMRQSRVMLYRGDLEETFCFAAAEAQAAGVPLVTAGMGSLGERVVDGETGFVCEDPKIFARKALRLLREDELWRAQHRAALASRETLSWNKVALEWEKDFGIASS